MKMKSACSLLFILLSNKLRLSNSLITAVTPCNDFSAACTLRRHFLQHYHAYDKFNYTMWWFLTGKESTGHLGGEYQPSSPLCGAFPPLVPLGRPLRAVALLENRDVEVEAKAGQA